MPNNFKKGRLGYPDMPDGRFFQCIVATGNAAIALDQEGKAWAIGSNCADKLGRGEDPSLTCDRWREVCCGWCYKSICTCGNNHIAIRTDGKAVSWGGTCALCCFPVEIGCGCNFAKLIPSPSTHYVGWLENGCAVSFDYMDDNCFGKLGRSGCAAQPLPIDCNYEWSSFSPGWNTVFGIRSTGKLYAWGVNTCGVLGICNYSTCCCTTPTAVCNGTCFLETRIYDAYYSGPVGAKACAIGLAGNKTVIGWGLIYVDPDTDCCYKCCTPSYAIANDINKLSTFGWAGIKTDGTAATWGLGNLCGRLGNCTYSLTSGYWNNETAVCCYNTFKQLVELSNGYVGITTDGYAVTWGENDCGQLGIGSTTMNTVPIAVCCNHKYKMVVAEPTATTGWYGIKSDYSQSVTVGLTQYCKDCTPKCMCTPQT